MEPVGQGRACHRPGEQAEYRMESVLRQPPTPHGRWSGDEVAG
ncbi:MAG TPA: hypothetical protein VFH03_22215 [Actinoplanes sp.]|nr:hypothetical protein [Actinoplanes sp.]